MAGGSVTGAMRTSEVSDEYGGWGASSLEWHALLAARGVYNMLWW